MAENRAIIHTVLVAFEVETNLGGHKHQVLNATVLSTSEARVFHDATERQPLAPSDNRVVRTRNWLSKNLPKF